jgi:sodium-independent sulfate anion transporter 11
MASHYFSAAANDVRTDPTWNHLGGLAKQYGRAAPTTAAYYAIDKFPIIGWLPRYNPRWLINDAIAGLTIGLMLIPQSLSYAKIATIPVEYGLMSSWLPPAINALMGTTKGESSYPRGCGCKLTQRV